MTAYLSAKGALRAKDERDIKVAWKYYIPAGVSGVLTIGCILGANRLGARRTIAAQVLLAASERAYSAYRDEVVEEFGERKDVAIRDQVAEKAVLERPPAELLVASEGEVLCCELYTGRYFKSSMEKLRKAENELNAKLLRDDYCSLDEFYYILGVAYTSSSSEVGWRSDKLMGLSFHAIMYEDKPVMAFEYENMRHL